MNRKEENNTSLWKSESKLQRITNPQENYRREEQEYDSYKGLPLRHEASIYVTCLTLEGGASERNAQVKNIEYHPAVLEPIPEEHSSHTNYIENLVKSLQRINLGNAFKFIVKESEGQPEDNQDTNNGTGAGDDRGKQSQESQADHDSTESSDSFDQWYDESNGSDNNSSDDEDDWWNKSPVERRKIRHNCPSRRQNNLARTNEEWNDILNALNHSQAFRREDQEGSETLETDEEYYIHI